MVRVRYTGTASYRLRGVGDFEHGDVKDVQAGTADRLTSRPQDDFEHVGENGESVGLDDVNPGPDSDSDEPAEDENGPDDKPDSGLEDGLSGQFDTADELAEEHWRTATAAVEAGKADDYLEELEAVDYRASVQGAIEDRRDELEE